VGLRLRSGTTLQLQSGAVLQCASTSTPAYNVVGISGVSDVRLVGGGSIIGNNLDNRIPTPTATEAGCGIGIYASSAVVVEGITVQDCFCDGIYVADSAEDVTISGVTSYRNRRHGMAMVKGRRVVLRGSTLQANTGSVETSGGPLLNGCGLDLEPNAAGSEISDILVSGCTFKDNQAQGLLAGVGYAGWVVGNVIIDGNTVTGNRYRGIEVENTTGAAVTGNGVSGNAEVGIYFHAGALGSLCAGNQVSGTSGSQGAGSGNGIECYQDSGTLIDGNTCTGNSVYGIYAVQSGSPAITRNSCPGNGVAGIYVTASPGATVSGNTP
jgi:parallel beta-helix repeat protein